MSGEHFYQNLTIFRGFQGITDAVNFKPLPRDWKVIITDVKGSTDAIDNGRYKDVNTVGAATIVAAMKGMDGIEFPFVFGGDGASLIIPPNKEKEVLHNLIGLKNLSESQFGLGLRVGMVELGELYDEGAVIEVAKFELAHQKCIAIFRGGGLNLAEVKIKGDEEKYGLSDESIPAPDLTGLSCRWNPIPNKKGVVLSLLVEANAEDPNPIYDEVLNNLEHIFEGQMEEANPVNIEKATYRSLKECIANEKRYHDKFSFAFLHRMVEIVAAVLIFKFKIPPLFFNPKRYSHSMRSHSDFRKFDDMLRMIVDATPEQVEKIEKYLESEYQKGTLFYGLHQSENSLMTCYVDDLTDGNHIHFIDGGNGGYAMAAKGLKAQLKKFKSAA